MSEVVHETITFYNLFCLDCYYNWYNRTGKKEICPYCHSDKVKVAKDLQA